MQEINNINDEVHVGCPCCKNRRLFDADPTTEGIIKIKCCQTAHCGRHKQHFIFGASAAPIAQSCR